MNIGVWGVLESSPFARLTVHSRHVQEAMGHLAMLVSIEKPIDPSERVRLLEAIRFSRQEADGIKRHVRAMLHESVYLPIGRRDLIEVLAIQDTLINQIEDISGLFCGRNMEVLAIWAEHWTASVHIMNTAVALVVELNENLKRIIEAGFGGRMYQLLVQAANQLDDCEHEHDRLLRALRTELYQNEASWSPIDAWFYYQLLEHMGNITDLAQRFGFQLMVLVAR